MDLFRAVEAHKSSATDRHSDFRAVFLSSDQGLRVLYEILGHCRIYQQSAMPNNVNETFIREGKRSVGLWVMDTLTKQPKTPPTKSQNIKRDPE